MFHFLSIYGQLPASQWALSLEERYINIIGISGMNALSAERKESGRTGVLKMILELALESWPDIKQTGN